MSDLMKLLWAEPFGRGYLCGAALAMFATFPVIVLQSWEIRSLKRRSVSASEQPK